MIKACPELTEMGAVVKRPMGAPAGAASAPVVLSYANAWPSPFAVVVKMPGDAAATVTFLGVDVPLPRVTTMFAVPLSWPGSTLNGSCALIWFLLTKYRPAGIPLNVTDATSLNGGVSGTAGAIPEDVHGTAPYMSGQPNAVVP